MTKFAEMFPGREPAAETEDDAPYKAFMTNRDGRPAMGFTITHADGTMNGVMYHSLNFPKFQLREDQEFVTFTYGGFAIGITGSGLRPIFDAIMRHTLVAVNEHDGQPAGAGAAIVTAVEVRGPGEAPVKLVKGEKLAS